MRKSLFILMWLGLTTTAPAHALELRDTTFNVLLGASATDGILSLELQNKNHAISFGLPTTVSYKYFFNENGNTQFVALYYYRLTGLETDETIQGVQFDEVESQSAGTAYGYRWRWQSGWNLSLNASVGHFTQEFTRSDGTARGEKTGIRWGLGINGGYRF